jgi:hypothetical protein
LRNVLATGRRLFEEGVGAGRQAANLPKPTEAVDVQVLPAGQMPGDYDPGADACVISL